MKIEKSSTHCFDSKTLADGVMDLAQRQKTSDILHARLTSTMHFSITPFAFVLGSILPREFPYHRQSQLQL
jgi:hypothetical protein